MAHWIVHGAPDVDVSAIHVDRFRGHHCTPAARAARVGESLAAVYAQHYPRSSPRTARGALRSPLHSRLRSAGACFGDTDGSGWEVPQWFAAGVPERVAPLAERETWGKPDWWPMWAAEHAAARSGVVLADRCVCVCVDGCVVGGGGGC